MAAGRVLRYLLKSWFSKPVHQREIYSWIRQHAPIVKIAELGLGKTERAQEVIEFAQLYADDQTIQFLGVDMFEGRPGGDGIPLKTAHKTLNALGAKVQLVPGDAVSALPRVANAFRDVQLLIISADQDVESIRQSISWIPRMLNEKSLVLWEVKDAKGELSFGRYSMSQIEAMTTSTVRRAA
ncbi:hypothetical protein [Bremerella sp.]|uniref:hypothetical protein n=1 Tax=Bremerella sp. TaxID=2795602 RepID=UPI00391B561F